MLQILWFKRDLRLADHAALTAAAARGPVLPLVVVEPGYWQQADVSARQWRFWRLYQYANRRTFRKSLFRS